MTREVRYMLLDDTIDYFPIDTALRDLCTLKLTLVAGTTTKRYHWYFLYQSHAEPRLI